MQHLDNAARAALPSAAKAALEISSRQDLARILSQFNIDPAEWGKTGRLLSIQLKELYRKGGCPFPFPQRPCESSPEVFRKHLTAFSDSGGMGYHPRIESKTKASLQTSRTRNSELWFVNNPRLETAVLGFAAKYAARRKVKFYALAIEGNHEHLPALFPEGNRAHFMRDLNSSIARAVQRYVPEYPGGHLYARRYSSEFLPGNDDVEEYFFYTVLQPVQDGLVEKISEYPGYNCFSDAIWGKARKFKSVRWGEYNAARRHNPSVAIRNYTDIVELKYERLPGYENMSQRTGANLQQLLPP